jgi:hypothetical protein
VGDASDAVALVESSFRRIPMYQDKWGSMTMTKSGPCGSTVGGPTLEDRGLLEALAW